MKYIFIIMILIVLLGTILPMLFSGGTLAVIAGVIILMLSSGFVVDKIITLVNKGKPS